MNVQPKDFAW